MLPSLLGEEEVRSNVSSMVDSNNNIVGMAVMPSDEDNDDDGNDDEDDERFGACRILLECTAVVVAGNAKMLTGRTDTVATVVAIATMLRRDFIVLSLIRYVSRSSVSMGKVI